MTIIDPATAFAQAFGMQTDEADKTDVEWLAQSVRLQWAPALEGLKAQGITAEVIERAQRNGAIGYSERRSASLAPGEAGHGGPAWAAVVKSLRTGKVAAVDLHYFDPIEAGQDCRRFGTRRADFWTTDTYRAIRAKLIYVVLSPLEALMLESCLPAGCAAVALRELAAADEVDLSWITPGRELRLCLPGTERPDANNERPGLVAAWTLYDRLLLAGVPALLVDQEDWESEEGIAAVFAGGEGAAELKRRLQRTETVLIPGMVMRSRHGGRNRQFLPGQDAAIYWRYQVSNDFTQYVEKFELPDKGESADEAGDGPRERITGMSDVCGFRLAGISKVHVQSDVATTRGIQDTQPKDYFVVSVQDPGHGATLHREVCRYAGLHKPETWTKFGSVFSPQRFFRMLTIMLRTAPNTAFTAANFIGLCWRDGRLAANEGKDCFFIEPENQSFYHAMRFPRGSRADARKVVEACQATFTHNPVTLVLAWAVGAHLKCVLDFWPHLELEADKGAGKTVLMGKLEALLSLRTLGLDALDTDHRRRAAMGFASQPVIFDEISKASTAVKGDIDGYLQRAYGWSSWTVGAAAREQMICTPVMIGGEEVDYESLQSKMVRAVISKAQQGPMIPRDTPPFPTWNWLEFLAGLGPEMIRATYAQAEAECIACSANQAGDATGDRIVLNYAAVLTGWRLLCQFAEMDPSFGGFEHDLIRAMNAQIESTAGTRLPWVWILRLALAEMNNRKADFPYRWGLSKDGQPVLYLRASDVMHHLATAPHLRAQFDKLPVKTERIFKKQLLQSGVVLEPDVERTIGTRRISHMMGISLHALERYNLFAAPDVDAAFHD